MKSDVCILMATYNGEKYIYEQLQSIINQDYENWKLFIGDDNSTDDTGLIINSVAGKEDRIEIVDFKAKGGGQLNNFRMLLQYVKNMNFHYIMFSDQDDIWYVNKVSDSLQLFEKDDKFPTMVYTNYTENSPDGSIHTKYTSVFPKNASLKQFLVQNWAMGCTMMINAALALLVSKIPDEAENHDNWIMLVALTYGRIRYLPKVTMFHRIHENNVTTSNSKKRLVFRLRRLFSDFYNRKAYRKNELILMDKLLSINSEVRQEATVTFYRILQKKHKIYRVILLWSNKIYGLNLHKTIRLWLLI